MQYQYYMIIMKLKLGIIGAGGLIGSELIKFMNNNYDIRIIKSEFLYVPADLLSEKLSGLDIIINLAGYPISGRWNKRKMKLIYNSRINTTRNLVHAISLMSVKPKHLINSSAIGIYGDNVICDEYSDHFSGNFLARLVIDWEKQASEVKDVYLTIIRTGVVLAKNGGAYTMLRRVFKAGAGGVIGGGKRGFSFILMDDMVRIFDFVIRKNIFGVINAVSPTPIDNKTFTQILSHNLNRPAFMPIPSVIIKLLYGKGSCVILDGQKVMPARLMENGFHFIGNNLEKCIQILEK